MDVKKQKILIEPSDQKLGFDLEILKKAEEGDSFAQLDIGKTYYSTPSQGDNCKKAFYWLKLSAKQNNMEAQFRLGDLYAFGHGIEKCETTAYDWYLKSAFQGYPKALTRLHNLYHVEKSMYCRGQRDSKEAEWTTTDFKKKKSIRELNEYRVQQLEPVLTRIKEYFTELLTTCREQVDDEEEMDKQDAYLKLGFLYQHGYGIRKIKTRAIEFYTLAADKGNVDAQYNLGNIYHHSARMKWNYREAFKWYTTAVDNGHIYAHNGLAFLFLKGLSTDINYSKAIDLYTIAAEKRHVNAAISLATIFRKGEVVEQDLEKAAEWYRKAIMEGSTVAQNSLQQLRNNEDLSAIDNSLYPEKTSSKAYSKKGLCSRLRSDVSKLTDSNNIEKLKQLALNAMKGDGNAMLEIGLKYYNGYGFAQNKEVGFKWIKNAAKSGLTNIQCIIAKMYKDGDGAEQDYHKASIWYEKAAKKGDVNAQYNLGYMHYNGLGVRKDLLEASKWYTFAATKNNSDAQCQLGILRTNGEGLRQDMSDAFKWFNSSISQKNPQALHRLAMMYEHGNEVNSNFKIALDLFQKAAQLGSLDAQMKLASIYSDKTSQYYDETQTFKYYETAANQGSPEAKYKLAILYLDGRGVKQDFIHAYYLFKESSDIGYDSAFNVFSTPIDYSRSNDVYYDRVIIMFELVCQKGIASLEYHLGYHYNNNSGFAYENFTYTREANDIQKERWYRIAAEKGVHEAQYRLAIIYEERKDLSRAMEYYKKSYKIGNIDATYRLACVYLDGFGVLQNYQKAFFLFNEASDKGHEGARKILNAFKEDDQNEKLEPIKKMLQISAESGNVISQYKLGLIALNNKSSIPNIQEAKKWLKMAAQGGYIKASYRLALLLESNADKENNYKEIIRLYQITADKGHQKSLFRLAQIYHLGNDVKRDYLKAFTFYALAAHQGFQLAQLAIDATTKTNWETSRNRLNSELKSQCLDFIFYFQMWKHVAEEGNIDLQYKLGMIYEERGGDINFSKAVKWYSKAAIGSHKDALYRIGRLYEKGLGINQDYLKAVEFYEKAILLNNSQAFYQLGVIYQNGNGVQLDFEKALSYYKKAAEKGNSMAQFVLGKLYEEGKGTNLPQNKLEALKWYSASVSQGNKDAENWLGTHYDEPYDANLFWLRKFNLLFQIVKQGCNIQHQRSPFLGSVYYELGYMYFYGYGTFVSYNDAWDCFQKSFTLSRDDRATEFLTIKFENVNASVIPIYLKKLEMYETVVDQLSVEDLYELGSIYYRGVYLNSDDLQFEKTQALIQPDHKKASEFFRIITKREFQGVNDYYQHCSYYLGMVYFVDIKRKNNSSRASYYLTNALESGFSASQLFLDYINAKFTANYDEAVIFKNVSEWHEANQNLNNAKLNYNIGWMYKEGLGTQQDYTKSVYYYTVAAYQGYIDAYVDLGNAYKNGFGVEQDYKIAIEWYTRAANQKNSVSIYNLGDIYFNGEGVEKNYKLAFQYYKEVADQGISKAQNQLGIIYENGYGVEKNYTAAIEWYTKAASQNYAVADYNLGMLYFNDKGVERDCKLAFQYFKAAADQGDGDAQSMLGILYNYGYGVEQNITEAIEWYTRAAQQNKSKANHNLGIIYSQYEYVERDYKLAFQYYKASADQGDIFAQMKLANMYYNGLGIERDYDIAISLYSQVSHLHEFAMIDLAEIYHSIDCDIQNFSKALECYNNIKEGDLNRGFALRGIGLLYEHGDGVKKDHKEAFEYYRQSAETKNKGGYYNLALLFYYGKGVDKNAGIALEWFNRVIEEKPVGNTFVFVQNEKDIEFGVPVEIQKKYSIVSDSVIYGEAHYYLGLMYKNGEGVEKDHEKALGFFKIAYAHGVSRAKRHFQTRGKCRHYVETGILILGISIAFGIRVFYLNKR